jgi:DNA-binding LytR/AlgR family response regulator
MKYEILINKASDNSRLKSSVIKFFDNNSIKYSIEEFDDENKIDEIFSKSTPDLIFLDQKYSSLELAKKIKKLEPDSVIILIAEDKNFNIEEHKDEFDSVLFRPFTEDRLNEILNTSFNKMKKNLKLFMFKHDGRMDIIPYNDIIIFEKKFTKIKMYAKGKEYLIKENMNKLLGSLDNNYFAKCNSFHIINLKKVVSVQKHSCRLKNFDKEIPIGRKYMDRILKKINK